MLEIRSKFIIDDDVDEDDYYDLAYAYLNVYREAADFMNDGVISELNDEFMEEVGTFDDYDNSTYNNWMAAKMTKRLVESDALIGVEEDTFRFVYYNEDLVLCCVGFNGEKIRMELIPGSERIVRDK